MTKVSIYANIVALQYTTHNQECLRMDDLSNSVKVENSRNLLPVLKIVTRTAQLHIDILSLSM